MKQSSDSTPVTSENLVSNIRRVAGAQFTPRRILVNSAMLLYCAALWCVFDFLYSTLTMGDGQDHAGRVYVPAYDHGLAPNFDDYDTWGGVRYRLFANSLGFKDEAARDVPLTSPSRRVLLIGDSFAEGIGMPYEDSFAGLLDRAGRTRSDKIEFLNAGVASYSPSIYYKKIKYLLDLDLQFDEVVLFSDSSDVEDDATSYFCIDDDPKYNRYCTIPPGTIPQRSSAKPDFLVQHFVITNRLHILVKHWIQSQLGNRRKVLNDDHNRIGWTTANPDPARYEPLGVAGGIARSLENMEKLADLLAGRNIPLTIAVYPWAQQIAQNDRNSKQVALWRKFCEGRCKAFIDLFPVFFAEADRSPGWYERLYIIGDDHFSAAGNQMMFHELEKRLLP